MSNSPSDAARIVNEKQFILATRDTGYRSTAAAVAELIDNAIQADATIIRVFVSQSGTGSERQISLAVLDNGCGMTSNTLMTAMQFAGSSRFNDRTGLGRFGMGLPNSSVSKARRVDVFTWKTKKRVLHTYLDIDEISSGAMRHFPEPRKTHLPREVQRFVRKRSGTYVLWSRCDRLDHRKAATVAERLHRPLSQRFRYFLEAGNHIWVNDERLMPFDPLYLKSPDGLVPAKVFGGPLEFEFRTPSNPFKTSVVKVRFTELPVSEWYDIPVEHKRALGVIKGAGVSIVRSDREIDFGWYFMGNKRKENYDDWWRCEVAFSSELDELFGVTHSKQEINPTDVLKNSLGSHLEVIAHTLNSRVRAEFALARKRREPDASPVEAKATSRDPFLPPLRLRYDALIDQRLPQAKQDPIECTGASRRSFRIRAEELAIPDAFLWEVRRSGAITVTVNRNHAFYDQVFRLLGEPSSQESRNIVECFLIAFARTGMAFSTKGHAKVIAEFSRSFSNALAAYLGD